MQTAMPLPTRTQSLPTIHHPAQSAASAHTHPVVCLDVEQWRRPVPLRVVRKHARPARAAVPRAVVDGAAVTERYERLWILFG